MLVFDTDSNSSTLLSHAYERDIIERLRKAKARVKGYHGPSVLRAVCMHNRPEEVKQLLFVSRASVKTREGTSPFYYAVYSDCADDRIQDKIAVINHLFDAGASLYDDNGRSVIHAELATRWSTRLDNIVSVLPALLARDPALLESRYHDETPLIAVAGYGSRKPAVVLTLVEAGADVNARNGKGETVLHRLFSQPFSVSIENDMSIVRAMLRLLLDAGADPTMCASNGRSVLMSIIEYDSTGFIPDNIRKIFIGDVLDSVMSRPGVAME
jgi:ankyrin repeat protein